MPKYFDYTTSENRCDDVPLDKYIKMKLTILKRDFKVDLKASEIKHMQSLPSKTQVDNYARDLIFK